MKATEKQLVDRILQIIDAYETAPGKDFILAIKAALAQINYREVDSDTEVVISKEEHNQLLSTINRLKQYDEQRDIALHQRLINEAGKEKALEIYIWFKNIFISNKTFGHGAFGWTTEDLMVVLDVFVKQFNIDLEKAHL